MDDPRRMISLFCVCAAALVVHGSCMVRKSSSDLPLGSDDEQSGDQWVFGVSAFEGIRATVQSGRLVHESGGRQGGRLDKVFDDVRESAGLTLKRSPVQVLRVAPPDEVPQVLRPRYGWNSPIADEDQRTSLEVSALDPSPVLASELTKRSGTPEGAPQNCKQGAHEQSVVTGLQSRGYPRTASLVARAFAGACSGQPPQSPQRGAQDAKERVPLVSPVAPSGQVLSAPVGAWPGVDVVSSEEPGPSHEVVAEMGLWSRPLTEGGHVRFAESTAATAANVPDLSVAERLIARNRAALLLAMVGSCLQKQEPSKELSAAVGCKVGEESGSGSGANKAMVVSEQDATAVALAAPAQKGEDNGAENAEPDPEAARAGSDTPPPRADDAGERPAVHRVGGVLWTRTHATLRPPEQSDWGLALPQMSVMAYTLARVEDGQGNKPSQLTLLSYFYIFGVHQWGYASPGRLLDALCSPGKQRLAASLKGCQALQAGLTRFVSGNQASAAGRPVPVGFEVYTPVYVMKEPLAPFLPNEGALARLQALAAMNF